MRPFIECSAEYFGFVCRIPPGPQWMATARRQRQERASALARARALRGELERRGGRGRSPSYGARFETPVNGDAVPEDGPSAALHRRRPRGTHARAFLERLGAKYTATVRVHAARFYENASVVLERLPGVGIGRWKLSVRPGNAGIFCSRRRLVSIGSSSKSSGRS